MFSPLMTLIFLLCNLNVMLALFIFSIALFIANWLTFLLTLVTLNRKNSKIKVKKSINSVKMRKTEELLIYLKTRDYE